jgi:hypothetical protein
MQAALGLELQPLNKTTVNNATGVNKGLNTELRIHPVSG